MPDLPPAGPEQIAVALVECGLNRSGFKVSYEKDLESELVVIDVSAGASASQFGCIRNATRTAIVQFKVSDIGAAYDSFESELARPQVIASARDSLAKAGKLEGLPLATQFPNMMLFAQALELHCGYRPGEVLVEYAKGTWTIDPTRNGAGKDAYGDYEKVGCIFGSLMAQPEDISKYGFSFGFIGNEVLANPEPRK